MLGKELQNRKKTLSQKCCTQWWGLRRITTLKRIFAIFVSVLGSNEKSNAQDFLRNTLQSLCLSLCCCWLHLFFIPSATSIGFSIVCLWLWHKEKTHRRKLMKMAGRNNKEQFSFDPVGVFYLSFQRPMPLLMFQCRCMYLWIFPE